MKTSRSIICIFTVFLFLVSVMPLQCMTVNAGTILPQTVFFDDFENATITQSKWSNTNITFENKVTGDSSNKVGKFGLGASGEFIGNEILDSDDWQSYVITTKVNFPALAGPGIAVKYIKADGGSCIFIRPDANGDLQVHDGASSIQTLTNKIKSNTWYKVKIDVASSASDTKLNIWIVAENADFGTTPTYTVTKKYIAGNKIAIRPYVNALLIDDFKVETIPTSVPSVPTNLTLVSKTATTLDINWVAPTTSGGVGALNLKYNVYLNDTTLVNTTPISGTSYTITNLTTGMPQKITVKAINSIGESGASSSIIATPIEDVGPTFSTTSQSNLKDMVRDTITVRKAFANTTSEAIDNVILVVALYKKGILKAVSVSGSASIPVYGTKNFSLYMDTTKYISDSDVTSDYSLKALLINGLDKMSPLSAVEGLPVVTTQNSMRLWYDEPAPNSDTGWTYNSLPLGNGWFGANIFGGTDMERIQLSEKTVNVQGGLTNFAETYIDFPGHTTVQNYERDLDIDNAVASVKYNYNNVDYKREYFTSYPDKVMVMKFTASQGGKISLNLRPEIPFLDNERTGTVVANGDTITLSGLLSYYKIKYEAQFKVIPTGGQMTASNTSGKGAISVTNADSVIILVALGTNYTLNSQKFMNDYTTKIGDAEPAPTEKITATINSASQKTYDQLYGTHYTDYNKLFSRVKVNLDSTLPNLTTDDLLKQYKAGTYSKYLEELLFQYGRYLLIASSREGTMPAHLQGIWNNKRVADWTGGYWYNINLEMNYWPAFNTNLAETFSPYIKLLEAQRQKHKAYADSNVQSKNPTQYDAGGDNGWTAGTANHAYEAGTPGNVSCYGTGPFVAQNVWENYRFTGDKNLLNNTIYNTIYGSSLFTSKIVRNISGYGDLLLCSPSYSPEQSDKNDPSGYKNEPGTYYDQQLVYMGHQNTIKAASDLGITNDSRIDVLKAQLSKLDPITVGWSGQIKEFRTERYYGDYGEYNHRHISNLVAMYPGELINPDDSPAWLDAAKVTLTKRGDKTTGYTGWATSWGVANKVNMWARALDGNRAYDLYRELLGTQVAQNLWSQMAPFQIDGNSGGTAGFAEMLLQSQLGYIQPLPARPDAWATGMYQGLVARGNFEVSAWWKDGQATKFEVLSNNGGLCKVKYYNLSNAKVTNSKGENISFNVINTDLISFDTVEGEAYRINNIPIFTATEKPTNLAVSLSTDRVATLSWTAGTSDSTYRVYKAIESSPTYTLLADNLTATQYVDNSGTLKQCTYKVVAVKNGRESVGITKTLSYVPDSPTNAVVFKNDNFAQLIWTASANTEKYNIYEKQNGQYVKLLTTTDTTSVITTGIGNDLYVEAEANSRVGDKVAFTIKTDGYAKRVDLYNSLTILKSLSVNKYDYKVATGMTNTITSASIVFRDPNATNTAIDDALSNVQQYTNNLNTFYQNITHNVLATSNKSAASGSYPISNVTDGDLSTRFYASSAANITFEIPLDATFDVDKFTIAEFRDNNVARTDQCTISVMENGVWRTVVDKQPLTWAMNEFRLSSPTNATRLKVDCVNTHSTADISIFEIQAWGYKQGATKLPVYTWDFTNGNTGEWNKASGLLYNGATVQPTIGSVNGNNMLALQSDYNRRNGSTISISLYCDTTGIADFNKYSYLKYKLYIPVDCKITGGQYATVLQRTSTSENWIGSQYNGDWSGISVSGAPKTADGKYYIVQRYLKRNNFDKDLTGVSSIMVLFANVDSTYVGTIYVDDIELSN